MSISSRSCDLCGKTVPEYLLVPFTVTATQWVWIVPAAGRGEYRAYPYNGECCFDCIGMPMHQPAGDLVKILLELTARSGADIEKVLFPRSYQTRNLGPMVSVSSWSSQDKDLLKRFERALSKEQREKWKQIKKDRERSQMERQERFLEKVKQASNPKLRGFVGQYNKLFGLWNQAGIRVSFPFDNDHIEQVLTVSRSLPTS